MKFIVNTGSLLRRLNLVNGVISNRVVVPILEYFHFSLKDGVLTITATDIECNMRVAMPVEAREEGQVAVPGKLIMDMLKSLPEQSVTFTINPENNSIELSSDNGKYKIAGENAGDFPAFPVVEGGNSVHLPANVLANAINTTAFSIGTDEMRAAMTGLYVQLLNNELRFVSTDGNKLVLYKATDTRAEQEDSFIMPRKALTLLKNILSSTQSGESGVMLEYNRLNAHFHIGEVHLVCRFIDERFPDYNSAIPTETPNKLTVNRQELLSAMRRVSIFASKSTNQVRFKIGENELELMAQDFDYQNEGSERLNCSFDGAPMEISFNARFLIDMLGILDSDDVLLSMSEYNRPGVLTPDVQHDGEEVLMLLMPIVLNH